MYGNPENIGYQEICQHIGHLYLESRRELEKLYEKMVALSEECHDVSKELEATKTERDQLLKANFSKGQ